MPCAILYKRYDLNCNKIELEETIYHYKMDVTTQTKLTRDEWNSIELPVPAEELSILQFIQQGFHDPQKKENSMKSLYT